MAVINKNDSPLLRLRGVGKQMVSHLARLAIYSVQDLLLHFPSRYQDRTHIQPIRELTPGTHAVIEGTIKSLSQSGRTKLLCELIDQTGRIYLRFFHVLSFQVNKLKVGTRLRCYGEVRRGAKGLEMVHPEYTLITDNPIPIDHYLTPIYPATEGLSQYTLRKLTQQALNELEKNPLWQEILPNSLLQSLQFPTIKEAIHFVHRPLRETSMDHLFKYKTIAQRRLIFEELLAHRLSLLSIKKIFQSQRAFPFLATETLSQQFLTSLPFQLTNAQSKVLATLKTDLCRSYPMLRLVQGDVGSGKTVIAALSMVKAVENHYQAAMMAPTELLAEQHYHVFKKWLEPLGIQVVYLSGHIKGESRTRTLKAIKTGEAHLVLGTHALFQSAIQFSKLALVVIDEQHRFGVDQRALFRDKGVQCDYYPHQLVMTATPIPRTLAMSFYADLDCSTIDELPPGRTPMTTSIIANHKRDEIIARVKEMCEQGRQVYWVCPLIEESDLLNCQAASHLAEQLQQALPHLTIGLIHGRLRAPEKAATMRAFQRGDIQLLVATTVIEVGVDVANASVMVIENAERLGLSQLHQLRGRVGRGAIASHCVLLYQHPLTAVAKERLMVMRETTDGFKIAQRDLALRGPGEVFGTQQTGALSFRAADLLRDSDMLVDVQQAAEMMMREHADKIDFLIMRWMGDKKEYGKV